MAASLEDLREKVAEPSLLDATIGMELPLEVHIDSIRKGVERLNAGRLTARRFEDEYTKRLLSSKDIAQARHQVREIGHEDERKRSIQDKEFAMVAN